MSVQIETGSPKLPEVQVNVATPNSPVVGTVVQTRMVTKGGKKSASYVRHVAFDVSGTPLAKSFRAGQSFGVLPPGTDAKGKPHKLRLYSLVCPSVGDDGQGNVVATVCKRVIDEHWDNHKLFTGVASNYICDLNEGDQALLTGPSGKRFILPEVKSDHDYIFFATGTGIAPFRAMVMDLLREKADSKIVLIMGSPYSSDLLYDEEFTQWAKEYPNFRYLTAISREYVREEGASKIYVQERLNTNADELVPMLTNPRTLVYVCGIAGMEVGIIRLMAKLLPQEVFAQYVTVKEGAGPIDSLDRKEFGRVVRAGGRLFLEVY